MDQIQKILLIGWSPFRFELSLSKKSTCSTLQSQAFYILTRGGKKKLIENLFFFGLFSFL